MTEANLFAGIDDEAAVEPQIVVVDPRHRLLDRLNADEEIPVAEYVRLVELAGVDETHLYQKIYREWLIERCREFVRLADEGELNDEVNVEAAGILRAEFDSLAMQDLPMILWRMRELGARPDSHRRNLAWTNEFIRKLFGVREEMRRLSSSRSMHRGLLDDLVHGRAETITAAKDLMRQRSHAVFEQMRQAMA
jgi:hypothetical protein